MPNERSDVFFPLWRKKVDGAMFDDKCTVLPIWVRNRLFNITERFPHRSKKDPGSETKIVITHRGGKKTSHVAHVTTLPRPNLGPVMRLQYGNDVKEWLTESFAKTYHRNEQRKLHGLNGPTIEKLVPFWEFIDIEWDESKESFHFRAWYSLEGNITEEEASSLNTLDPEIQVKDTESPAERPIRYSSGMNKASFHTDCGHSVKVAKVKKIGGKMEGKYYAKISGPKIISKSGIKTIYFEKKEDAESVVNKFLYPSDKIDNHSSKSRPPEFSAWLVLQNPESIYADVEGECYEYPRSIPNGARIKSGDYLICSLPSKSSVNGKRIFGIGRISHIDEYSKNGKVMRKAFYDWYRPFSSPKTFEYIGGDPRNKIYNAMNSIPKDRVREIINLLVGEFSEDVQVMEKESEFLTNLTSDTPASNQFPDWLTQALNDADN